VSSTNTQETTLPRLIAIALAAMLGVLWSLWIYLDSKFESQSARVDTFMVRLDEKATDSIEQINDNETQLTLIAERQRNIAEKQNGFNEKLDSISSSIDKIAKKLEGGAEVK